MSLFDHPGPVQPSPAGGPQEPEAVVVKRPPRWSVGNWPVLWKVLAIALVPMVLAILFGALRISGARTDADRLRLAADRAEVVPAISDYMVALGNTMVAASSGGDTVGAKKSYDSRRFELQSRLTHTDLATDVRSGIITVLERGQGLLDRVSSDSIGLRDQVTAYAPILLTAEDAITGSVRVDDERIRAQAEGLSRAVGARGQMMMQQLLLNRGGELPEAELRTSMMTLAGTEPSTLFGMSQVLGVDSPDAKKLQQQMVTRMAQMSDPDTVLPNNPALRDSIRSSDEIAARVIAETAPAMTQTLEDRAADRRSAAIRDAMLMVAVIVVALAVVWLVARSLVRPLRTLRDGALRVAHTDLARGIARARAGDEREPTPLPVYTTEEVGHVAHAVDELHAQALLLAGDEARLRRLVNEMFETMARRNRSLVDQQLSLIDRLERDESDPDRLDSLFRLDHLAARMRRNGANLLVLADAQTSPDRGRSAPLSTVISAAISEVEDYRRVQTVAVPDVTVAGAVTGDVIHLLAELIDNALRYSPPTTQVQLAGQPTRDDGVLIGVADAGLGMTGADLRIVNMRMAAGGEVTPENARHMGLFVAGRLAHRHGIGVRLSPGDPGVVAEVYLPPGLLVGATGQPVPDRPPAAGSRQAVGAATATAEAAPVNGSTAGGSAAASLPRRTPGSSGIAAPSAAPASAPPEPPAAEPAAIDEDDLIYQRMLSEWLVDPRELGRSADLDWKSVWDHGWSAAGEAQDTPVVSHTEQGLPVRDPGARLVPGSATAETASTLPKRDPDAIRASMHSHFGGVRAARSHARHASRGSEHE